MATSVSTPAAAVIAVDVGKTTVAVSVTALSVNLE